jgi:hypothetical protein
MGRRRPARYCRPSFFTSLYEEPGHLRELGASLRQPTFGRACSGDDDEVEPRRHEPGLWPKAKKLAKYALRAISLRRRAHLLADRKAEPRDARGAIGLWARIDEKDVRGRAHPKCRVLNAQKVGPPHEAPVFSEALILRGGSLVCGVRHRRKLGRRGAQNSGSFGEP